MVLLHRDGEKALVVSQWPAVLERLKQLCRENGIGTVDLSGGTDSRGAAARAFQREPQVCVFLLKADENAGGLTLTAARHVFLFDTMSVRATRERGRGVLRDPLPRARAYSLDKSVELQAVNRVHRIGQRRPCIVHELIAQDTVEAAVKELQEARTGVRCVCVPCVWLGVL